MQSPALQLLAAFCSPVEARLYAARVGLNIELKYRYPNAVNTGDIDAYYSIYFTIN